MKKRIPALVALLSVLALTLAPFLAAAPSAASFVSEEIEFFSGSPHELPGFAPAPTLVWVGDPDLSDPDVVRIPFTVTNPDCCKPTTFVVPGFDSSWGICTGTSVGLDWEVDWFGGIEYDIDGSYPWEVTGRMAVGWYPPDHDGQFWPGRDDVGTSSGNYWLAYLSLQNRAETREVASAKNFGTVDYAKNDFGDWPSAPTDGNPNDYAGKSGGNHQDFDIVDPLTYGEVTDFDSTTPALRAILNCEARCCWALSTVGYTRATTSSDAVLHGEILYNR